MCFELLNHFPNRMTLPTQLPLDKQNLVIKVLIQTERRLPRPLTILINQADEWRLPHHRPE